MRVLYLSNVYIFSSIPATLRTLERQSLVSVRRYLSATNYQLSLLARSADLFFRGMGEAAGVVRRTARCVSIAAAVEGTFERQGGGVRRVSIPSRGL